MATWEKLMHQKHIYTISKMTAILTKIMPTLPLTRPHLSAREVWRNGGVDSFLNRRKIFLLNSNTFYAINFLYPPLVPAYYFSLAHTLLSFVYAYTHNSWHYLFWKDYNWHHCLWKEKKDVYYFWKKNKWHHCLMEGKLNMCLWHLHLH